MTFVFSTTADKLFSVFVGLNSLPLILIKASPAANFQRSNHFNIC